MHWQGICCKTLVTTFAHYALQEKELSMSGRNWGDAVIDGSTLVFNVAGKPAFRIPLTDVGQVRVLCFISFRF